MTRLLLTLALLAATQAGCSAIASRDPGPAPCEPEDPTMDPCPAHQHCLDGICVASCVDPVAETCNGADDDCNGMTDDNVTCPDDGRCIRGECRNDCGLAETCNGRDDDCDTRVDEMLDVDSDGDSYVACNLTAPADSDCNDRDPDIHPTATEICNGFDDDCDPATTDLSARCPSTGDLCAVPSGETVPRCINPRDCTLVPCPSGQLCNSDSTCCTMGTAGCGSPLDCRTTGCAAGSRCALMGTSSMTYTCQALTPLGGDCANDRDCVSGRCYTRDSLQLGSTGGVCGMPCCSDSDCPASGSICWAPGTGARSCILATELGTASHGYQLCTNRNGCAGQACVPRTIELPSGTGVAWVCGAESTDSCAAGHCSSGVCNSDLFPLYCVYACGTADDCPVTAPACVVIGLGTTRNRWVTGCLVSSGGGQGASCGNDGDCRDGLCLGGFCSDICCTDSDCPVGICGPIDHSGWEMRCIPRPPPS